jgi:very-short-patch-repair endonuclease
VIKYNPKLKGNTRRLRSQMTDAERALWARLRRKQVRSVQFYRQKPLGDYIVDFYGPKARIVVEVDGSQHMDSEHASMDSDRDAYLASEGLRVLRFDNLQVLKEIEGVMDVILRVVSESLEENPP